MRALRTTLASVCLVGLAPAFAPAAVTVEQLLKYRPTQGGVDYEVPGTPAAIAACKVEMVANAKGTPNAGFALIDGQGKLLCRMVDQDGNRKLDQWSYYQDGFEIYREIDLNDDQVIDEARWMNSGGTRVAKCVAVKGPNGKDTVNKIAAWSRISAEEASKVFVQALVSGDVELLETVMAKPEELDALGIPKPEVAAIAAAAQQRAAQVKALRGGLTGWDATTAWLRLDGAMPHLIPADAASGLKDDVLLYENAVIFAGAPNNPAANAGKMAFLQVGEMVKIGDVWKLVDLPRVIDPSKNAVIAAIEGGIRSSIYRSEPGDGPAGNDNPAIAAAIKELSAFDAANSALLTKGDPKDLARFHVGRIAPLRGVVKAAEAAGDAKIELDHNKLIVDSLAAAYASGAYPEGDKLLLGLKGKGGKVGSYAGYKQIEADFTLQNQQPGNNFVKAQKDWMANLKQFIDENGQSDEAPQALLLLASTHEMNGDEDEAKVYYGKLAEQSAATEWGKKAAGALTRLDLVGKPLALKGTSLQGQTIDAAQLKGKTVLVTFWATWASPAKRDLPELAKAYQKYGPKGFEVIGVALDNDKADLDEFLKASPLPWPEIFEPGGMESRLATEFGVISLPTMILVGPDGKVVDRNLRTAADVESQLDKLFGGKPAGVATLGTAN
ncbi:redoxin domain-containing protein [Tundrisphaera sp. TA3]|uniref:redoxin domain-containing protein n=1 Tax=Tundrisphaera sp. TA3 TaxID=3435775 RepID=UPI003EB9FC24